MNRYLFIGILACLLWPTLAVAQDVDAYQAAVAKYRQDKAKGLSASEYAPIFPQDTSHLQYFPVDTAFKVIATFEATEGAKPFEIPTYSGITKVFIQYGTLTFTVKGDSCQLALYRNLKTAQNPLTRDLLFLPIRDLTSGNSTYGGGRYIDIRQREIKRGQLILDFNKLYNPYCAYGTGWNCPVPPEENNLNVAIEAGEKNYTGPLRERRE